MKHAAPPMLAALLFVGLFSATVAPHDRISTRLSWDGDMSRIVQARCASCHTAPRDRAVPDLSTYADARPWARAIREAILEGHGYSAGNGAALTPFERELLVQWIDGGAPEKPKFNPVEFSRLPEGYTRLASPDPLKTLEEHRARLGGTRTIIPGLGLSLRTADRIIVFDRGGETARVIGRGTFVLSLGAHLASLPASTARTRLSDAAYIIGPANEPRTEVAAITPDGPERFWCSMHPDVRRPVAGACPRCAMPLVEMPAMSLEEFGFSFPDILVRGSGRKKVSTQELLIRHERRLHVFVVDERLQFFAHVHPEERPREMAMPKGRLFAIADFAPVDAMPQLRMASFENTAGQSDVPSAAPGVRGHLETGDFKAGVVSRVQFSVTPTDLEPYLGAAAHLFVIDEKLENPMHAHPIEIPDGGLSRPAFDVRFPRAGRYVMWLQVQRAGTVETMRFTADVSK